MSKVPILFNPGSFEGGLAESWYAKGLTAGPFKRERERLVRLLRSKHKAKQAQAAIVIS